MLKRLFNKLGAKSRPKPELRIIPRDAHSISRKNISPSALKVLYRLNEAGYDAYLVGGGVRDLLLGKHPKDFDVATNATPEEVKQVFRNCRLIGRRFRLAHVRFGREIIEVATFRSSHEKAEDNQARDNKAQTSEAGMILRDNVYGTQEEDAIRRDFTVNALYYNVRDFSVHDFTHGLADIQHRTLRMIGDPEVRYREDPVRMLRAIRFAAKLEFSIARETAAPIEQLRPMLADIPAARLFDESLKLLMSGQGLATFRLLDEFKLLQYLVPAAAASLNAESSASRLFELALQSTDQRIAEERPVTPAFLFAALLWPAVKEHWLKAQSASEPPIPAMHLAANEVVDHQARVCALPKRFSLPMKEIWELQVRLSRKQGKRSISLISHPRFRAAYDLLLLREQSGEVPDSEKLGAWWTDLQRKHPPVPGSHRADSDSAEEDSPRRPRRRRRPRKRRPPE